MLNVVQQEIYNGLLIGFNVFFAVALVLFLGYFLWNRKQISKKNIILTADQVITKKQHSTRSLQGIAILFIVLGLTNFIIVTSFSAIKWGNGYTIHDIIFTMGNLTVFVLVLLVLSRIVFLSIKNSKEHEVKKVVENKNQFKRNFIALIIILSLSFITNLIGIVVKYIGQDEQNSWLEIARTLTNYIIAVLFFFSGIWLGINAWKYSTSKTEKHKMETAKALKTSFFATTLVGSGFILGNMIIDMSNMFQSKEHSITNFTGIEKAQIMLSYLIGLGLYVGIIMLIYNIFALNKTANDAEKKAKVVENIKNIGFAIIILTFIIAILNIVLVVIQKWFDLGGNYNVDEIWYTTANAVIGICAFLIIMGISFNAINLMISNITDKSVSNLVDYKARIKVGMLSLFGCFGMFAIANIIILFVF